MNILLERILIDYSLGKFIFVVYNFWIYLLKYIHFIIYLNISIHFTISLFLHSNMQRHIISFSYSILKMQAKKLHFITVS